MFLARMTNKGVVANEANCGAKGDLPGVGEAVGDLEAVSRRADGEDEGVVALFWQRYRRRLTGMPPGQRAAEPSDDSTFGEVNSRDARQTASWVVGLGF